MAQQGQKIYLFDNNQSDNQSPITIMWGFVRPAVGEVVSVFNHVSGEYHHYTVKCVMHGVNTKTGIMVTSLYVEECKLDAVLD